MLCASVAVVRGVGLVIYASVCPKGIGRTSDEGGPWFVRKTGGLGKTQGTVQQNVDGAVMMSGVSDVGTGHRKWSTWVDLWARPAGSIAMWLHQSIFGTPIYY